MRRFFMIMPAVLLLFVVAVPAHAANLPLLNPNFTIVPQGCLTCPCSFAAVLQFIQNLMNAAISLGVIAFVVVAAYAGFSFMVNSTSPEARSQARSMLINVVVGMVIVLAAWLFVDFIMKTLYNPGTVSSGIKFGPWNEILNTDTTDPCIQATAQTPLPGISGTVGGVVGTTNPTSSGAGICAVQTGGPCSVANLTSAFGSNATTFSKICTKESSGCTILQSTVDKTTDGQPVSFGCFQVNITANPVAGNNCPAAFTAVYTSTNHNVQVKDPRLYQVCKAAAMNAATNIQTAAQLYQQHGLSPWLADKMCYQ